ncbi:hypothetical protein LCGC14_0383430 [marine sediment metagenome]|uniref:Uncharacterized protein n=1 Tax=marine sediment metagenome TaxID=412755 RepID=A0A0F9T7L8_9ZZZZ
MADPTPVTQEEVLQQLMVRGFETGFVSTPLRDFWGVLKSITGEMRSGNSGPYLVALYNMEEVEVLPGGSIEPYDSPIAQIDIPASTKDKSKMGYLGTSIDRIINAGLAPDIPQAQAKNMESLIGKKLHWQFTPGHLIPNRDEAGAWSDKPASCWVVTEIAGEGAAPVAAPNVEVAPAQPSVSASQKALELLDGKTIQQWHQVVMLDPVVKQDTKFLQTIIDNSFLASMESVGKVTRDEGGVHHVVA